VDARQERLGLLFAGLCALNGGFVPAMAKLTTGEGDALLVAAGTAGFAGALAALVLGLRGELGLLFRSDVGPRLALLGALGTGLAFFCFFQGASRTSAIEATFCLQIEPAYSLLLSWLALGHRPTLRRVAATGVVLFGIALVVGTRGVGASAGVALLLATPLAWQLSHLLVLRTLPGIPPAALTGARYVWGGLVLLALWLASGGAAAAATPGFRRLLPVLALQGTVLSYCGTLLWYQAIGRIDLARATAIVVPSVPVLSLAATYLLVGEVPTAAQWLGLVLTAGGVLAYVTAPHAVAGADSSAARKGTPQPTVAPPL
jgi:O-acetylserine/cysteine efflux transporter